MLTIEEKWASSRFCAHQGRFLPAALFPAVWFASPGPRNTCFRSPFHSTIVNTINLIPFPWTANYRTGASKRANREGNVHDHKRGTSILHIANEKLEWVRIPSACKHHCKILLACTRIHICTPPTRTRLQCLISLVVEISCPNFLFLRFL